MTTLTKPDISKMSHSERRALTKIVQQRFSLLATQLNNKARDLRAAKRAEILAARKADAVKYDRRLKALHNRFNKLHEECMQFAGEAADAGYTISNTYDNTLFSRHDWHGRDSAEPTDLKQLIDEAVGEIVTAKGKMGTYLKSLELDLTEELTIGAITSDEGTKFLGKIPTVEQIVSGAVVPKELVS